MLLNSNEAISEFKVSEQSGKIAVLFHKIPAVWEDELKNSEPDSFEKSSLVPRVLGRRGPLVLYTFVTQSASFAVSKIATSLRAQAHPLL